MDKKDCLNADWQAIGYKDGASGQLQTKIDSHRQACAKYEVKPDLVAYDKGRLEGLWKFCHPSNGFKLGTQGYIYEGICANDLEPSFLEAYEQGKNIHPLIMQISANELKIEQLKAELIRIRHAITTRETALIRGGISDTVRNRLIEDLNELISQQYWYENAIADRQHFIEELQKRIRRLKAMSSYSSLSIEQKRRRGASINHY